MCIRDSPYIQLIEQQARSIEVQQDDYTYTLNYDDFVEERAANKKINEKFSALKDYHSTLTFDWIAEPGMPIDDVVKERKKRWVESLEQDFYIDEAVNILEDLNINLDNYPLAQIKK